MSKLAVIVLILGIYSIEAAKLKCGSSTSSKSVTVTNESSPPSDCEYKIKKSNSKVCQLRIELNFELAPPTFPSTKNDLEYTQCVDDYLEIGGYKFCGKETNQHIYLPFEEDFIPLSVISTPRSEGSQLPKLSWKIQVRQLECTKGLTSLNSDLDLVAPAGCLQYFPEVSGTINSFNFNNGEGTYNGNLNYAICFQRTPETQGIRLTVDNFRLGYSSNVCPQDIKEDFLFVPFGYVEELKTSSNVFCGSKLRRKTVVTQSPGPISIIFNSAGKYNYDVSPRGFSLSYELFSEE